jgi:hypothetical protein
LARNLPALEFDHRRAENLGSIGIRTALRESETVAYGDAAFDLVSGGELAAMVVVDAIVRLLPGADLGTGKVQLRRSVVKHRHRLGQLHRVVGL